ncbi:hypothetical protein PWT90_04624 [Aphanocladium album]|nr:hypothetical protein PWT90_04624 [Aphanocladium album]
MVGWPWSNDKPPAWLALRSSSALITVTVSFAVFTDVFLYAVVVPVIPFTLRSRIGVEEHRIQYWVSVSLAVFAVALFLSAPIWGWMADKYQNRRIPMLVGLVWLLASTLLLCFSTSITMLLIARILQGLSAAMTWSVGLALLIDSVDKKHVGRATGWTSTALTFGILLGPLIGGIVYDRAGNYAVFGICFGLIAIDVALRLVIIEVKDAKKWLPKEPASTEAPEASIATKAPEVSPSQPVAFASQSPSVDQTSTEPGALENGLSSNETRKPKARTFGENGIIGLLKKRRMLCALFGVVIQAATQTSFDAIMPLEVHDLFGWNSIGGGLIFLPIIIPTLIGPIVGHFSDKYGPRWFTASGFIFSVPFFVCFRFVTENTINHKVMLCGLLFALGIGEALQVAPLMAEISWATEDGRDDTDEDAAAAPYAQAYALYNISFSLGAIIGPLLSGMVRQSAGFGTVGWSLAILNGFTALIILNWVGGAPLYRFREGMKRNSSKEAVASITAAASNTELAQPTDSTAKPQSETVAH